MELATHWISEYGYFGIFSLLVLGIVGLPVPDETLLVFAGYLIFRGHLNWAWTYLSALLGSLCGITLSYTIGRLTGYIFIERYGPRLHIGRERIDMVHDWFRRFGRFTLTFGYFVPGVRHLTAYVAGASCLEPPTFALYAYSGAVLWAASFISLGYFLGERWNTVGANVERWMLYAGIGIVAAALGYWLLRRRRSARRT